MRCSFCGKELALLKRLRGGEFCSDAHQRQYHHEYNQLAVNRLLQSREAASTDKPEIAPILVPPTELVDAMETVTMEQPVAIPVAIPESLAKSPERGVEAVVYSKAEAVPGVEIERLLTAVHGEYAEPPLARLWRPTIVAGTLPQDISQQVEAVPWTLTTPQRPRYDESGEKHNGLAYAGSMALAVTVEIHNYTRPVPERQVESREFARTVPVLQLDLSPMEMGREGSMGRSLQTALEIPLGPPAEPGTAMLWRAAAREFAALTVELGPWGQVDFTTTGFAAPGIAGGSTTVAGTAPVHAAVEPPIPAAMTKTLPVALKALAPAPSVPLAVVVPSHAWTSTTDIPRLDMLPLRAVMILGPAVSPTVTKAPKNPAVLSTGKTRRPEVRILNPVKPAVPSVAVITPEVPKPELAKVEVARPEVLKPQEQNVSTAKVSLLGAAAPPGVPRSPADLGLPELRLETLSPKGVFASIKKITAGIAALLVLALGAYFLLSSGQGTTITASASAGTPAANGDWIDHFENGAGGERHISLLRASTEMKDYRMEFDGGVESKALGWVFRARDGNNYYGAKIEERQVGAATTRMAVHYAVINGAEQSRKQIPLTMKIPAGTPYKIRLRAKGGHFTMFVQGQQVDDWTDTRLATGGAGILSEGGERGKLSSSFNLVPLGKDE